MLKKILAVVLALVIVMSFAACGQSKDFDDIKGEITSNETEEVELDAGVTAGDKWENKSLGLGFKVPDGWTFKTQDEINQLNNLTDNEDVKEAIKNATTFYDMMVTGTDGSSVSVIFEKLPYSMSVSKYLDSAKEGVEETFATSGYSNIEVEKETYRIGSMKFEGIETECTYQGIDLVIAQLVTIVEGNAAVITVTSFDDDGVEAIIKNLYQL